MSRNRALRSASREIVLMQRIERRNVIVGAGAMGSAAAYHLARQGEPVLLIEQFALGHDRGSSHGAARITRHSYADLDYARLMPAAFQAWRELEADAGQPLYLRTGGVSLCPAGVDYVEQVAANLAELGVPHRRMNGRGVEPGQSRLLGSRRAMTSSSSPTPECSPRPGPSRCRSSWPGRTAARGRRSALGTPVRRIDLEGDRPVVVTRTSLRSSPSA